MSDTTTQTGGGPIAAPDGGTQGQPRKLPTRPGWWWVESTDDGVPEVLAAMVFGNGHCRCFDARRNWPIDSSWLAWLAPIPGPAVCAALAEYDAARREIVLLAPVGAQGETRDMSEENEEEQWWWCLHCERVNHGERPDQCPHGDCDGDWLDMWPWDQIRDGEGFGDYPLTPDPSMVYPMYADTHGGTRTAYPATGGAA